LDIRDSLSEMGRRDIDLPHHPMQTLKRQCIVLRRNLPRLLRLKVGQQRDLESVSHKDTRLDSRF